MGNSASMDDNQEASHQSGASRLMNSIFMAVCIAPLLILGMVFMLGYNEQQAVCDAKAITEGSGTVKENGCDSAAENAGSLVLFHCDLQMKNLQSLALGGSFQGNYTGIGIRSKAEMYQCVEHEDSETKKDSVGGGKTTIKTYTYSREWRDSYVDSRSFHKVGSSDWDRHCGEHNPPWEQEGLPQSGARYAASALVGPYTVTRQLSNIPLDTPVTSLKAPSGWDLGGGSYRKGPGTKIGDARVSFYTNDWGLRAVTVVGKNDGGAVVPWRSSGAWLCKGNDVYSLKPGVRDKESMFQQMHDDVKARTWVLRIVGLILLWLASSWCFAPLGVAADCMPCVGPFLGDSIESIACCVSCLPATACCLGITGMVWCAMRPFIGIPLMLVWIGVMGALAAFVARSRASKGQGSEPLVSMAQPAAPSYGIAQAISPQQPAQVQRQLQVTVPLDAGPGTLVQVQTPEGAVMQVAVPAGAAPGSVFMMAY